MRNAIRLAVLAAIIPAGAAGAATLIHAGRLVDGVGDVPRERVTVVVDERAHPRNRQRLHRPGRRRRGRGPLGRDRAARIHGHARPPDVGAQPHQRDRQRQEGRIRPGLRFGRLRRAHAARGLHDRAQPRRPVEHLGRPQAGDRRRQGQGTARFSLRGVRSALAAATRTRAIPSGPSSRATTRASIRSAMARTAAARPCASATRTAPTRSRSPRPAASSRSRSPAAPRNSPTRSSRP